MGMGKFWLPIRILESLPGIVTVFFLDGVHYNSGMSDRERARRYRARIRRCAVVVPVEISLEFVNLLIETNWLPADRSEDREAIMRAVEALHRDLQQQVDRHA
jgi:hypothetical protein